MQLVKVDQCRILFYSLIVLLSFVPAAPLLLCKFMEE